MNLPPLRLGATFPTKALLVVQPLYNSSGSPMGASSGYKQGSRWQQCERWLLALMAPQGQGEVEKY